MTEAPRFIVVEGPIGVGKTTLARRLAETLGAELVAEVAQENPFLERFYQEPRRAALPVQLYFLMQRARQFEALAQSDLFQPVRVADFMMEKDRLFAELNLDDDELALYEQVYARLTLCTPQPDLVIYLQAPVESLQARIAQRGIACERAISDDYLARLSESYARFFLHYDQAPLLIVNSAGINPVAREDDYRMLLERIMSVRHGRHYFNPAPMEW
jgi:deoxyadenosine/deoxycytidine kinase